MAEDERLGQGEEETVRPEGSAQGAEDSLEEVTVPDFVRQNIVAIALNTGRILREFLRSLGWEKDQITEFNRVVTLMGDEVQKADYATALEAFETLKSDLRKIFANQQYEGATITAGNAVGVDKILRLLSSPFQDFAAWILFQHTLEAAPDLSVVARVDSISTATLNAAAQASNTVTASPGRQASQTGTRTAARA